MKTRGEADEGRRTNRRLGLLFGFGAYLVLVVGWSVASSRRADSARLPSLDAFTPLIQSIVALGGSFERIVVPRMTVAGWAIAALLALVAAIGLVRKREKVLKPALFLLALALAAFAQCRLLQGALISGACFYAAALVFAAAAELLPKRCGAFAAEPKGREPGERTAAAVTVSEIAALAFVTTVALIYRVYALNQLPSDFEGEAAYFMACATSFKGAALVNAGVANGPWSPFGWLYYLPIYAATELLGSHLLSIRLISALTGVISIPLLWALLRRFAGPLEALLGSVLLCFALTDMFWSRTDIFPYHAPGLIGIALAWCTYEAIVRERLGSFVLAAILMAVSYHQFPSGQTLFLIPLGAVGIHALLDPGFRKRCWKKALVLLVGAALWYGGQSLNVLLATGHLKKPTPFALNPGKTLWSLPSESPDLLPRAASLARKAGQNAADVVRSKFAKIVFGPHPHHEAIPSLQGLPTREISAAAAVLAALGVFLLLLRPKDPVSQVLLAWIVAALLPGLLSTSASAHRTAAVFPAFLAAAALAGGDVFRAIRALIGGVGKNVAAAGGAALFAGLAVVAARLYLGVASHSPPPTVVMSEAIRPYLAQGTLAVLDVDLGDYLATELTYLFIDDLSRGSRPPLWRISRDSGWPETAFHPSPGFGEWYYAYTRLRKRPGAADPSPQRVVFLVQDRPERRSHVELLGELYPRVTPKRHTFSGWPAQYSFVAFVVEATDLAEVASPIVLGAAAGSSASGPDGWWEGRQVRLANNAAPEGGVTVSAALWIDRLRWSRFRCPGAGEESRLLLDGAPVDPSAARAVTRGAHRIDIRLGKSPRLPLFLEEAAGENDFQRFPAENVLGPAVATRPAFAPETVVPYAGYEPPMPLATLDKEFLAAVAVSPSGELGSLWAYENRWKVALVPPGRGKEVGWEVPRPEDRSEYSLLAFAGNRIALLNFPYLFLLDRSGRVVLRKDLRPQISAVNDLGANEKGELFVSASVPGGIHVLSPDGELEALVLYPEFGPNWAPQKISVPPRGPIGVFDQEGKIRVFERVSGEWRAVRSQPGLYPLGSRLFQIRSDGWLFARVWDWPEVLVFDPSLKRRIAKDRFYDLSGFDMGSHFLGFDDKGSLYVYNEGSGQVFRLVRRAE